MIMNRMKHFKQLRKAGMKAIAITGLAVLGGSLLLGGVVSAQTAAASSATTNQQHLENIITKGDAEIARRLTTLGTLSSKINGATKLTSDDKATLSSEVNTTISGLTSLKTTLDADTTVAAAITNAQSIYTEYRVYALVAPKVGLIKVADDQQVVEAKLTALAPKLQSRVTAEQQAGKDVTALQSELGDMTSKTSAAQAISSNIESSVINLEPTDYNSNHSVLVGDNTQLQTAHTDDQAAYSDAENIVSTLKSM